MSSLEVGDAVVEVVVEGEGEQKLRFLASFPHLTTCTSHAWDVTGNFRLPGNAVLVIGIPGWSYPFRPLFMATKNSAGYTFISGEGCQEWGCHHEVVSMTW